MRRKDGRYALAFVVVRVPGCNVLSGGCSTSWQGEEKEEEDKDEDQQEEEEEEEEAARRKWASSQLRFLL